MEPQKFSWAKRAKSIGYAVQGLRRFFKTQHNAVLHAVATVAALVLAIVLHVPVEKTLFLVIAIALVWMAELFNTAIEQICDLVCPHQDPRIKYIKDIAAAAVLVTALMAVITACIIFIPVLL